MHRDNEENLVENSKSNHDNSDVTLIIDRDDEENLVEENIILSSNISISSPVSSLFEYNQLRLCIVKSKVKIYYFTMQ